MSGPDVSCHEKSRMAELLAQRESDVIAGTDRAWLAGHLSTCRSCYRTAATQDPTVAFLCLSASQDREALTFGTLPASEEQRRLAMTTTGAMQFEILKRRLRPGRSPFLLRAASIFLATAGLAAFLSWGTRAFRDETAAHEQPGEIQQRPSLAESVRTAAKTSHAPSIEGIGNPGAKVYQFTPTSHGEPTVVFVVDRNAEF